MPDNRYPSACVRRSRAEGGRETSRLAISPFRDFVNWARRPQPVNPFVSFRLGPSLPARRRALPRWKALPLMLSGGVDGVSADDDVASATLSAIRQLARDRPTVYLPTHDPESSARLASRRLVDASGRRRREEIR
jgi:hypothetical protein